VAKLSYELVRRLQAFVLLGLWIINSTINRPPAVKTVDRAPAGTACLVLLRTAV
jgi:hypothetical protein